MLHLVACGAHITTTHIPSLHVRQKLINLLKSVDSITWPSP